MVTRYRSNNVNIVEQLHRMHFCTSTISNLWHAVRTTPQTWLGRVIPANWGRPTSLYVMTALSRNLHGTWKSTSENERANSPYHTLLHPRSRRFLSTIQPSA